MVTVTVQIGWTAQRPILPDQHVSTVTVAVPFANTLAATEIDAILTALAMVNVRPSCVMATSTTIVRITC